MGRRTRWLPPSFSAEVIAAGVAASCPLPTPFVYIERYRPASTDDCKEMFDLIVFASWEAKIARVPVAIASARRGRCAGLLRGMRRKQPVFEFQEATQRSVVPYV